MALELVSRPTFSEVQILRRVNSGQFRRPSLELIQDTGDYLYKCVPLYRVALKGDWKVAKPMLEADIRLLNAAITKGWATILHVVAGTNHIHFVQELINMLDEYDLELQDFNGNTAFCFAAAIGNTRITKIMMDKNDSLPMIRGGRGATPLHMAALQGRIEMVWTLYPLTESIFQSGDWVALFFICINNGLYDFALKITLKFPQLAFALNENGETGLHVLARKPSAFKSQGRTYVKQCLSPCAELPPVLQIVRNLWIVTLKQCGINQSNIRKIISHPSQITFDAAKVGNVEFLAELIRYYPELIWEMDSKNRSIIHIAVLNRHAQIFNLIHEIGSTKDFIITFDDVDRNNLLHCAAKLAPPTQLNLVSGAAFQMMHELLWFEEVKKIMLPSDIAKQNLDGKTPKELFTEEHKQLLTKAESWMKGTAEYCMIVSTLIATGVFTAAFSIPGGNNDSTGAPNSLKNPAFLIFALSDATALIFSSTSILIFLSILISRYAEDDFLKSLPLKLISGLLTLFISITAMMVAFSSAFFIAYENGLKWAPISISVLAFLPIPLFALLQFPLCCAIVYSVYSSRSLFRPNKHLLY